MCFPSEELDHHIPLHLKFRLFLPRASFSACPQRLSPARTMTNFLPSLVPSTLRTLTSICSFSQQNIFKLTIKEDQQTPLTCPRVLLNLSTRQHWPHRPGASALNPGLVRVQVPLVPTWLCRTPWVRNPLNRGPYRPCLHQSGPIHFLLFNLTSHFKGDEREAAFLVLQATEPHLNIPPQQENTALEDASPHLPVSYSKKRRLRKEGNKRML